MAEWAGFSELFDGETWGVQGRRWVFCREDDSWGIWESGDGLNAEALVSRSILLLRLEVWGLTCVKSWELNSFQPVIPHQCVWGCTSFISFILTLTSTYSLFHDTWTLGARILLEMYPYVYMGLGSTCLNFELLWFSSMFSVAKRYFLDEEWVLQVSLGIRTGI